jgi:ADP-dependent NAD(P)H-hydrate dehydratase / NAD(P)H-hydrate epimerase
MTSVLSNSQPTLAYRLCTPEQIRMLEQQLAQSTPEGLYGLMEQAGAALDGYLQQHWPHARLVRIFCGQGNNGGDGYVLARLAQQRGVRVQLFALGPPKPRTEAARACQLWLAAGGQIQTFPPEATDGALEPDLLVDALLGIGPETQLHGPVLTWIDYVNQQTTPVLAVDLPSGLHARTGAVLGAAVKASRTLSFMAVKPGLLTGQGPALVGQLTLHSLGAETVRFHEHELDDGQMRLAWVDYPVAQRSLTPRSRTAHKGNCGRVLLLGGGLGMPGSIRLAAEAALRAGAGLVKIASRQEHQGMVLAGRPELMWAATGAGNPDYVSSAAWATIRVLGPGLGLDTWARTIWAAQLAQPGPIVLDADGLNLLAESPSHRDNWVLTPHPGEASRLLACSIAEVEQDRFLAVRRLQQQYGGVVLLKGAGTLVCDGQTTWLCQEGNPGMASGGMGDLLSGIIAALWGQGLAMSTAAWVGVCIHGEAADCAARAGERGMLASDLLPFIRRLVNPAEAFG